MGKKSIPWAVGLTGLLYFGMLGYWQYDELMMASGVTELQNQGAIFGFGYGVVYVAFLLLCFTKDLPDNLKEVPIIGRYGKMLTR